MKCYICDQTPPTTAMRYNVADAVGICHRCGIGVCAEHSHKEAEPGAVLLCTQCASPSSVESGIQETEGSLRSKSPANNSALRMRPSVVFNSTF